MSQLPPESATAAKLSGEKHPGWSVEAYLLADVYGALTGEVHPSRAEHRPQTTSSGTPVRDITSALRRQALRRRRDQE